MIVYVSKKHPLLDLIFYISVILEYLNFYSIIFIKNLQIHPKHNDKESGVLGMVKVRFIEVKLQNFAKSTTKVLPE